MAKRIQASESLIGKKIKCIDGYSYKVTGINTYGYKLECGGPQVPANRVIKKGRGFAELDTADPENAYTEEAEAPAAKPARKTRTRKAKAKPATRTRKTTGRRKAKAEEPVEAEKPARKTRTRRAKADKSPIKRRAAKDTTLELDHVEVKAKSKAKAPVKKTPINKFTKALTNELRAAVKAAILEVVENSKYDIEIKGDNTVEAMYNNSPSADDKTLDGPICRMAFDLIPVDDNIESGVSDDDMVDDEANSLTFDSEGCVDLSTFGTLSAEDIKRYKRSFDKLAKKDVNVGSFAVGHGVLHVKSDTLFVLAGCNGANLILVDPDSGATKRISPAKLVSQCEYIDLTEFFSANTSDEDEEDDLDDIDSDDLDFDDDDLLDPEEEDEDDLEKEEDEEDLEEEEEDEDDLEKEEDEEDLEEEEEDEEDLEEEEEEEEEDFDEDFGDFE